MFIYTNDMSNYLEAGVNNKYHQSYVFDFSF